MLFVLKSLSECTGEYHAVMALLLLAMLLARKGVECAQAAHERMETLRSREQIEFGDSSVNEAVLWGVTLSMLYLFATDGCHWSALQEQLLNRGGTRRWTSYAVYVGFGTCLAVQLGFVARCVFVAIVAVLWFVVQETDRIDVEKFRVAECAGFLAMAVLSKCCDDWV